MKMKQYCMAVLKSGGDPWGLRPNFVPKDVNVIPKPRRPIVQIFLIAELAVLETGETPFDAAALPPVSYMFAAMPVKGHELHAILSGGRRLVIFRRIAVVRHQHVRAGLFELGEYGVRTLSEPEICINVCDPLHAGEIGRAHV